MFPFDARTRDYLALTGRAPAQIARAKRYLRRTGLRFDPDLAPALADRLDFNLGRVGLTVAGPKRPDERRSLAELSGTIAEATAGGARDHGDIVIAAITACTNTSNPAAIIAAGLRARTARARGLTVAPHLKTLLAPASRVVRDHLDRAGLTGPLEDRGFHNLGYVWTTCIGGYVWTTCIGGYGWATCIGNSGELAPEVAQAIETGNLTVAAVLSGHRNCEGRIHARVRANHRMSPPLVVAHAIAGTVRCDLTAEPLGIDPQGRPVMLAESWPDPAEIARLAGSAIDGAQYRARHRARHAQVPEGDAAWAALPIGPDGVQTEMPLAYVRSIVAHSQQSAWVGAWLRWFSKPRNRGQCALFLGA